MQAAALNPKFTALINALKKTHGIADSVTITVALNDGKLAGYCWYRGQGAYTLMLSPNLDEIEAAGIIGHEIVHVAQRERGDLSLTDSGYVWKGQFYTWDAVPYGKRPHEIEARRAEQPALQRAFNMGIIEL
jgi:hypothetical protein